MKSNGGLSESLGTLLRKRYARLCDLLVPDRSCLTSPAVWGHLWIRAPSRVACVVLLEGLKVSNLRLSGGLSILGLCSGILWSYELPRSPQGDHVVMTSIPNSFSQGITQTIVCGTSSFVRTVAVRLRLQLREVRTGL